MSNREKDAFKKINYLISTYKNTLKKKINQKYINQKYLIFNWIFIIIIYLITFFIIIILIFFIEFYTQFFNLYEISNPNSTRYLLSSLIQSQAAILAIVITLTLIAVQLASSSYSPRVIKIFKLNPDFYMLLFLYGFSIFYMSGILKIIPEDELIFQTRYALHEKINISLIISFFTFAMLVPYFLNILKILQPSSLIKYLAKDITNENIYKSIDKIKNEANPLLPILDIIRNSCLRHDFETTRNGLREIEQRGIDMLKSGPSTSEADALTLLFVNELESLAELTVNLGDDNSSKEIVKMLHRINETLVEIKSQQSITRVNKLLKNIGMKSTEKHVFNTTQEVINSLYETGKTVTSKDPEIYDQTILYLGDLARNGIENKDEVSTLSAISMIRLLGIKGLHNKQDMTAMKALWLLELIGKNKGIYNLTIHNNEWEEYSDSFEFEGEVYEEKIIVGGIQYEISIFNETVRDVFYFGEVSIEQKLFNVTKDAISKLRIIGENAIIHRFDEGSVPDFLGHIGILALGMESNKITLLSLNALDYISKASDVSLKETINETALSLIRIGVEALNKDFVEIARSSVNILISLESGKISTSTIKRLMSLDESYKKFETLYRSIKDPHDSPDLKHHEF